MLQFCGPSCMITFRFLYLRLLCSHFNKSVTHGLNKDGYIFSNIRGSAPLYARLVRARGGCYMRPILVVDPVCDESCDLTATSPVLAECILCRNVF